MIPAVVIQTFKRFCSLLNPLLFPQLMCFSTGSGDEPLPAVSSAEITNACWGNGRDPVPVAEQRSFLLRVNCP